MTIRTTIVLGAIAGFLAVVAGTFGAHGLDGRIAPDLLEIYEVGARYHMYHALAILACAGVLDRLGRPGQVAVWCFLAGIVIFAGTLYGLALSGQRWLGAVTPIGGVTFLAGWVAVVVGGTRLPRSLEQAQTESR